MRGDSRVFEEKLRFVGGGDYYGRWSAAWNGAKPVDPKISSVEVSPADNNAPLRRIFESFRKLEKCTYI